DVIQEEEAWQPLPRLLEQPPQLLGNVAMASLGEIGACDHQLVEPELAGRRAGQIRLAVAGRTVEQNPTNTHAQLGSDLRVRQHVPEGVLQTRLDILESADVGEGQSQRLPSGGLQRARSSSLGPRGFGVRGGASLCKARWR